MSVLLLAELQYSSVTSAQKSEKLQKKRSSTNTNRRGEEPVWEVKEAQVEGEDLLFLRPFDETDTSFAC